MESLHSLIDINTNEVTFLYYSFLKAQSYLLELNIRTLSSEVQLASCNAY